jgi:hypothetical protein
LGLLASWMPLVVGMLQSDTLDSAQPSPLVAVPVKLAVADLD